MTEYSVKQVETFFQKCDPDRVESTTAFMKLYAGHHDDMAKYLKEQYGSTPSAVEVAANEKKRSIFGSIFAPNANADDTASKRQKPQPKDESLGSENQGNAVAPNKTSEPNLWAKFQQSKQDLAFKVKELTSSTDSETLSVQKKVAMALALWETTEGDLALFKEIVKATNEKSELVMEQVRTFSRLNVL
jgi:hypothetical protein